MVLVLTLLTLKTLGIKTTLAYVKPRLTTLFGPIPTESRFHRVLDQICNTRRVHQLLEIFGMQAQLSISLLAAFMHAASSLPGSGHQSIYMGTVDEKKLVATKARRLLPHFAHAHGPD